MLSIIWLTVGALVSFWCCHMEIETGSEERDNPLKWMFGAISVSVIALTVTSGATVEPAFHWLLAALPEPGTDLSRVTALVLTALGCATYAFGLPLAFLYGLCVRAEKKCGTIEKKKPSALILVWRSKK